MPALAALPYVTPAAAEVPAEKVTPSADRAQAIAAQLEQLRVIEEAIALIELRHASAVAKVQALVALEELKTKRRHLVVVRGEE